MKIGDLVTLRSHIKSFNHGITSDIGMVVEKQTRGPAPGAYVLWPSDNETEWVRLEDLKKINLNQLPTKGIKIL
jgi:hypothetical protein